MAKDSKNRALSKAIREKMSPTHRFNYRQYQRAEKAHAENPSTSYSKAEVKSIHRHRRDK